MWHLEVPAWEIALRSIIIYAAFIAAIRLFGKRQAGQLTILDIALLLVVANAIQPAMTGPDSSVPGGLIIIFTLYFLDWAVGRLGLRYPPLRRLLEPSPTVLARNGRWIRRALDREGISLEEAEAALRQHGLTDVQQARLVILEAEGTISVIPREEKPGETLDVPDSRRF